MNKKDKGKFFENIACKFLEEKKIDIIERNYKTPFGEIDIIGKDQENLVFFEVKGAFTDKFKAYENINEKKKLKIQKSGLYFIKNNKDLIFENFRFDAIIITMEGNYFRVSHLKNI
ncbi:MAG: YraN family protein [Spirochaetes bacterium]|nr:YraN family protein [Spirochaetota bacterium]